MRSLTRLLMLLCVAWSGVVAAQGADKVFAIDGAASDVHWLVFKSGALARLGHNHVIAVPNLTGSVTVAAQDLSASHFEFVMRVADLVIDDAQLRSGLGDDFASVPTAKDVEGTRHNMLTDRVLDGDKFPTIRVTGVGPLGAAGAQTLKLKIELLGRTVDLTVPTSLTVTDDHVEASGTFDLNHADLGMQPFTALMGALSVGEKMSFSYHIVARPAH
ncbi:MAG: YceI family protein [Gammaproteobacteria bacterium]